MNRFLLTALVTAAWVFPCAAQTKEVIEEVDAKLAQLRIAARHADERAEDVEVLRRLLNKSLGLDGVVSVLLDPPTSWKMGSTTTAEGFVVSGTGLKLNDNSLVVGTLLNPQGKRVTQAVGPFDGVYLKGAGVVYTLRIPAGADLTYDPKSQAVGLGNTCTACHTGIAAGDAHPHVKSTNAAACTTCHDAGTTSTAAVSPSLSDWDRTRMELRGEKPQAPEPKKSDKPRKVLCAPGSLTELLAAQLFAHARNVRHLGEKESITLVVTFDSLPGAKENPSAEPAAKLGLTSDEVQALTLGDLHLKQGKHTEAVEAYRKGLTRFQKAMFLSFPSNVPWKDAEAAVRDMTTSARGAYKSLAAAYLQLGDLENAKWALSEATGFQVELVAAKSAEKVKPVGPAKLIVSVAKADVAAKDAAAFKKAVTVERVHFPAEEKKVK